LQEKLKNTENRVQELENELKEASGKDEAFKKAQDAENELREKVSGLES